MDAAWSAGDSPVVGVVDPEDDETEPIEVDRLEGAVADAGGTVVDGGLEGVLAATPSLLVIPGEAGLSALTRAGVDTPVLPVGPVCGIESVDRERLSDAVRQVLRGAATRQDRPVLEAALESRSGESDPIARERALFDVTLITDEPARISEYGVYSRGSSVATFRADGVVVATPAGTHGYASAVDAPQLSAAVDAVAVAPIGPFVTQTRQWVLPNDGLDVTVEREESDVTLVADGDAVGAVTTDRRVTVAVTDRLSTLSVPERRLADD
ncbi:ATP-NAD/AcoX kinase [Natrinema pellirubrum DSM 15624]|uniref:ATP-NAD/AcoX kinase n=1 Tax=Natrinema pellirubrum (strain DSM 15624 / CIP 106293 / JCM 10476 / NCIMB 786 / 157) TaxID=797303 RepID=L0JMU5_NATP1|nr:NAD(+)/NADH kinase [Natrinema pellirubrum]AGB32589.1 putative sugar kinase [Natrinema pellirubrum DSM 15624]ELY73725.1 ATP-NAD/AcoX kinase [Natrinema pellirubrum DSM 15624]